MQRALVVVSPNERSNRILREAGELAAGSGAELVVLTVLPDEEFERTRSALADVGSSDVVYGIDQATESATRKAKRLAREALDDLDVDYRVVADIGPEVDSVLETAEAESCDHLFVSGRRRSPTGKLLSRDVTQTVMLNFDGPVTVLLGEESETEDDSNRKSRALA
ncbi:universal stress protein [Haloferax mediterranei ATCC 33500]|uniref:Universal stress protein n=1 Tax=Haloferax mediterranei (strain ATCC 33500 / DSM 1411 / JCM 8866 / NBRC 14739 / NCIMB 2177 / R-4) TaxID=523841 RepID=I3R723_HALMT|nr:universal stress protein [Haloferax mediterranei]AFK20033.2 UpsA domain-containing protein [Haloferax mediterranei ATCC 33500]AHZ23409.1 universal stress protein UspA [Haloferax mediterranei ATCC 33500]ELZ99579.1 UpsA domain-containing protein [Haloferax mediterranei ATCC 33500]MDX5987217.1 universal stress protein [Haloferax mediterranei ATCC 33500]QCQ76522.1 universal stress protein [Haloferax mediterranei ATCC 33500]